MSDREGGSGSDSQASYKDKTNTRTPSQAIPAGPSGSSRNNSSFYANEPFQFRIRGTSVTDASPPQFVTLEDIMKAAHGMQNMALAHEIAVDKDFKLEPFEPPDNSYQKIVKETLHKAYFDILREQLNSDPPVYNQAFILLEDVKQGLFSILLPRHTRLREMIEEVLDADLIKQQAEKNCLDFCKYADFVIDLMAKMAAPVRDEMIQNITKLEDTVDIFRAILEALEVLKLDLANTLITMIRPHVQQESVLYERAKFDEILKVSEDGLKHTREWLKRHIDKTGLSIPVTDQNIIRNVTAQTLAKAYLELLEWDASKEYPETMTLDAPRFADLSVQVYRLICVASIMLVSPTCSPDMNSVPEVKKALKRRVTIIFDNASNDIELKAVLPSIAEDVILMTEQFLEKQSQAPMPANIKELVRTSIVELDNPDHKVRQLVRTRVLEFLKEILVCGGGSQRIPIGLSAFTEEMTNISGTLLRYVMHNKAVFSSYYFSIIDEELSRN